MYMIVAGIHNVWHNDSINNLIKREYYPNMDAGKDWKFVDISISHRDSIPENPFYIINNNLLPAGYTEKQIRISPVIEVTVTFLFLPYQTPLGGLYTIYKGHEYYFGEILLLKPTSYKKWVLNKLHSDEWENMHNNINIYFILLDGKLYLDPCENNWKEMH